MGLASVPSTKFICKMFSSSDSTLPLICKARSPPYPTSFLTLKPSNRRNLPHKASISHVIDSSLLLQALRFQGSFFPRHSGLSPAATGAKNSGSGEEDKRALETVLKLYAALRSRDINELSDVIGEECRCVCNFVSMFRPFHGKKQVLDVFSTLMKYLGNDIQFVVIPTVYDGMSVGVYWKLEWKNTHVPLGKGYSFYMCHNYQGKVMIRNVEMFMEPLLHFEPLRLKIMIFVMAVMDKIGSDAIFKGKVKKGICLLMVLSLMATLLLFA